MNNGSLSFYFSKVSRLLTWLHLGNEPPFRYPDMIMGHNLQLIHFKFHQIIHAQWKSKLVCFSFRSLVLFWRHCSHLIRWWLDLVTLRPSWKVRVRTLVSISCSTIMTKKGNQIQIGYSYSVLDTRSAANLEKVPSTNFNTSVFQGLKYIIIFWTLHADSSTIFQVWGALFNFIN